MIKVREGQVWNVNGLSLKVRYVGGETGTVRFTGGSLYSLSHVQGGFIFEPQSDLEELAVKMDKWPTTASEALIILRSSGFYWRGDFIFKQGCKSIFKKQWQNMRYHLGLDKKPHYRLTGGEWVKV